MPDNLKVQSKIMKSEEMLSSQVLCGIPEVDLGSLKNFENIFLQICSKIYLIFSGIQYWNSVLKTFN